MRSSLSERTRWRKADIRAEQREGKGLNFQLTMEHRVHFYRTCNREEVYAHKFFVVISFQDEEVGRVYSVLERSAAGFSLNTHAM